MVDDAVRLLPFRTGGPPLDVPRTVDDALRTAWPEHLVPGEGATRELWELLATLGATDLGVARAVEPHLDARAILTQAGVPDRDDRTWGVYAAEGPGVRLDAVDAGDGWRLGGTKPWCSLAGVLDAALVTAHLAGGGRALFAVDLHDPGVRLLDQEWASRGLTEIPSTAVAFDDVVATPVGAPGWYLERPGFWWGGIGVAACWFGGAVGIGRRVHAEAAQRDDPLLAMHLGAVDHRLEDARRALAEAAWLVDAHDVDAAQGRLLAKRVRATVAGVCEDVLTHAAHALGPAPLALEPEHAKRVADLQVYVRQQHAERDDVSLGHALASAAPPW
ncbi:acyl-CoA dehydrogenase [Cellulomonas humilata]|uniref:Alkylation response protein AidB-like acyl-CoA dehydrogenase n=1 Tax=Cellulomonas humilata TaxID=144055 RepID=A0ABU0EAR6_9CELL|nr:acyl-CoA dehydrogenase [Cellulomonas humilata]MDQ0372356.1 alkylation response protein AidB-like acyl-CoA dehydrogenase [Cellulomonas humilata]